MEERSEDLGGDLLICESKDDGESKDGLDNEDVVALQGLAFAL